MGEVCDSPIQREVRYDRQLRLWGEHGQSALEKAEILVCGVNTTTCELTKNLILPGVGRVILADSETVTETDLLSNFFYLPDAVGKSKAESVYSQLSELNPTCRTSYEERKIEYLIDSEMDYLKQFSMIIISRIPKPLADRIKSMANGWNIPVMQIESFGMFGRIYLSLTEHCLYESHPDNTIPDLRLDQPFAEIHQFCTKFDLDKMTSAEHSHVPYIVPLFQALSTWRRDNDNKFPSSYKEKVQVRQLFEKMRRTTDEENFNEGAKAVLKLLSITQVPTNVKEILKSPKIMHLSPSTNIFWFLARALHDYLNDPLSEGLLPLRPNLPDMTADSASYVELTKIYRDRAARDLDRFRSILSDLCQASQIEMPDFSTITNFCNNIPNMKVMNQYSDSDVDYDDLLQDPEALCILNLVFDAFLKFKQENCRFPGDCDDSELESDKQNILSSINRKIAEPYVEEMLRSAGLELHSIASYLGGISAQEVIKILTSQYVPIDNCLFYDGIRQQLQVQKF